MNKILPLLLASIISVNATAAEKPAETPKETRASLTDKERDILDQGPIESGTYIAGGVVGTLLGLGIGHAIQGRYGSLGWVFTVGEVAGSALVLAGAANALTSGITTSTNSTAVIGVAIILGFRIWELIDVWASPPSHNKAYRRLKKRLGEKIDEDEAMNFFITPVASNGGGAAAGFQFRF